MEAVEGLYDLGEWTDFYESCRIAGFGERLQSPVCEAVEEDLEFITTSWLSFICSVCVCVLSKLIGLSITFAMFTSSV